MHFKRRLSDDGKTNLEECLAGTDPNVNEDIIFRDSFEQFVVPQD